MLDGLLGRGGFSSKCKSLIKPTKTRIEVLRRRAEAKQRFLKEDLVKLLSNGLDINAYGRTEEYLAGHNLLSCYNFLEQACEFIYKQLSVMQKQSECPEEYREPVASLMFAAARFSDLPELRDLRDVFQDRYGNSLEYFVNQVFVEKLASKPPTMEKRLQLLQDIASEYSIKWDSKAFQQRMANPSVPAQDKSIKNGPSAVTDGKYKLPNIKNAASQADTLSVRENIVFRREGSNIPFVKQEVAGHTPRSVTVKAETSLKGEKVQEEGSDQLQSSYNSALPPPYVKLKDNPIPPPYVKPNVNGYGAHHRSKHSSMDSNGSSVDPSPRIQTKPAVSSDRVLKSPDNTYFKEVGPEKDQNYRSHGRRKGSKHVVFGSDGSSIDPSPRIRDRTQKEPDNSDNEELNHAEYPNDLNNIPLPKPRSIRRKHPKPSSNHKEVGSSEDSRIVKRIASSKRKERKGLQILFDDDHYKKDNEEKMMDKLLLHYSKKSSTYDIEKLRKKPQSSDVGTPHTRSRDGPHETPELLIPTNRSRSLPREQSGEYEPHKVFTRANSFQPDYQAKHVHPKLPDYDDLAARFAALKGQ